MKRGIATRIGEKKMKKIVLGEIRLTNEDGWLDVELLKEFNGEYIDITCQSIGKQLLREYMEHVCQKKPNYSCANCECECVFAY